MEFGFFDVMVILDKLQKMEGKQNCGLKEKTAYLCAIEEVRRAVVKRQAELTGI